MQSKWQPKVGDTGNNETGTPYKIIAINPNADEWHRIVVLLDGKTVATYNDEGKRPMGAALVAPAWTRYVNLYTGGTSGYQVSSHHPSKDEALREAHGERPWGLRGLTCFAAALPVDIPRELV